MRQSVRVWLAGALCFAPVARGQQMAVDFDPATTKINWSLVGNVHTTHGTFQLKQGHVTVNPANGEISGELVVAANSGDSANAARDKRMNKEILETDKYPEIRFKVMKLEGAAAVEERFERACGWAVYNSRNEPRIKCSAADNDEWERRERNWKICCAVCGLGHEDPSNFLFKVNKTVEVEVVATGHVKR